VVLLGVRSMGASASARPANYLDHREPHSSFKDVGCLTGESSQGSILLGLTPCLTEITSKKNDVGQAQRGVASALLGVAATELPILMNMPSQASKSTGGG
jgi:hypothetical protein